MNRADALTCYAQVENGRVALTWQVIGRADPASSFQIQRREHADFTFGVHYAGFFASWDPTGAVSVARKVPVATGRFVDRDVQVGSTYSYAWFDEARPDQPLGTAYAKVRDNRVWWTYRSTQQKMMALAEEFSDRVRFKCFGHSIAGHPIEGVIAGVPSPAVAVVGLVHPGESGPELALPALRRLLQERPALFERCGLAVLPAVNRDERDRMVAGVPYYMRTNANGVDLNRNFDGQWHVTDYTYGNDTSSPSSPTYRGDRPASEPETRAVVRLVEDVKPAAIFSLHWLASVTGDRLLGSKFAADDAGYVERCERFRAAFSAGFREPDAPSRDGVEYVEPGGSLPAWAHEKLGIPAFDVEHYNDEPGQVCRFDHTNPAYLAEYQGRYARALARVMELSAAEDR
ncbi:MAG: M14 family zinc carboxypeptidase [Planctomycetota bacterium]